MKIRGLPVLLGVLLLLITASPALASGESQKAADTRNSVAVVDVGAEIEGQWVDLGHGSGFFVGESGEDPQYLITNHHVIETFLTYGSGELMQIEEDGTTYSFRAKIRVYFSSEDYVEAYFVDSDSIKDIALLRLAQPTDQRVPLKLRSPEEDMVGQPVWTVGYPGLSENELVSSVTSWGATDATLNQGTIGRLMTTSGTGVSVIQSDAVIMAGNSGGPMVDQNGAVIGINSFTIVNTDTVDRLYYAVSIDEVIPLLRLHEVPYEMAGSGGTLPVLYLALGAAAAAVVVVVVLVLVLRKKPAPAPVSPPADVSLHTDFQPPAPGPAPAPVPGDSGLRFQALSGALAGRRFSINGTVRIGRDPSRNDLVYPAGAQGVSGVHCMLSLSGGNLYLKDLGSTYGTFLGDGRRLAANESVQLKIGDRFWLGSESERFVITGKGGV